MFKVRVLSKAEASMGSWRWVSKDRFRDSEISLKFYENFVKEIENYKILKEVHELPNITSYCSIKLYLANGCVINTPHPTFPIREIVAYSC